MMWLYTPCWIAPVALLAEGVDRNIQLLPLLELLAVALRVLVALLAEGVDRNISRIRHDYINTRSSSSPRA